MKKVLCIELSYTWVLTRIDDSKYPIETIKEKLLRGNKYNVVSESYVHLTLETNESDIEKIKARVTSIFTQKYGKENLDALSFSDRDKFADDESTDISEDEDVDVEEEESAPLGDVLERIETLVGAKEFKDFVKEIVKLAPEIKKKHSQDVFMSQSYLFSIGDGGGLTTYLESFATLIDVLGLASMSALSPVAEIKLDLTGKPVDDLSPVYEILSNGDAELVRVLCIDISKWIDKTDTEVFKKLLKDLQKASDKFIFAFRVPFVDKDVLGRVATSLNDLMSVRVLSIPPFDNVQTKEIARRDLQNYGLEMSVAAWQCFFERIAEEKRDGKFYGLNTIKKVVKELVYKKQVALSNGAKDATIIGVKDARKICSYKDDKGEGMAQLDKLVGCEQIKRQIEEILAQIELAKTQSGLEKPCLHMRFVGSPGTGKTTVARILGKILKEKEVLRIGNLYEYKGRDFCGQYIGETAPKTSGMCRDAYGSVLFIDEAYSLYRGDDNSRDYGIEAIDTLISEMENHKDDLVVIMAGYTDDMEKLMDGNRGLKSRMPYTIEFPNFTREQLFEIYKSMASGKFKTADDLYPTVKTYFEGLSDEVLNSKNFSNARFVRNLFERTWAKAAMRCQLEGQKSVALCASDFTNAASEKDFAFQIEKKIKLGF
ncbi:MAG: AAA family ATPase [Clostridia bacterium]|nr:AAA family ATPase [Clostridia bacterium]